MKINFIITVLLFLFGKNVLANELPDLGEASQADISPYEERQIGLEIMSQIRSDSRYLDDAEIAGYLTNLGYKLISASDEAHPDQEFEFFAVRDPSLNAFALPGGFMGFNSGLILAAQSESELAGVMAHEISHVTQKHLARMISGQKYGMLTTLASIALAIMASRANPQAGTAVMATSEAILAQSQLNFTRANEKEADRIGLAVLMRAGFDPAGMASFFGRLQRASRFQGDIPSYLRTHPLSYERIADIENRIQGLPYKQVADSIEFQLVRAKLRAAEGKPLEAVKYFESNLKERRYSNETVERYGLISALLREGNNLRANEELKLLYESGHYDTMVKLQENHLLGNEIQIKKKILYSSAMIETLAARVKFSVGLYSEGLHIYREALKIYPQHRALIYDYAAALLYDGNQKDALRFINRQLRFTPNDIRLYQLQAKAYEADGNSMLLHRALAESYIRQGDLPRAINQLEIALKSEDGDFYEISSAEARLKELRHQLSLSEE
ncbi:MAG: peptidase M48 [Nitrosomonadaceae bacterium]|nr:peptidase M48 [Nitrosomonadaceae bacterium]|tara:strand:+ start:7707 stop:9209 length:1503 start_codon:yes stop_codon:yes gene_type:complete